MLISDWSSDVCSSDLAGLFEVERNGLLHSWNPAFVRTLGSPPEPPELQALLPAHEAQLRPLIDESLNSGEPREADLELRAHDGNTQWAEISLTPMDNVMLKGVINDITQRKRAERQEDRRVGTEGV